MLNLIIILAVSIPAGIIAFIAFMDNYRYTHNTTVQHLPIECYYWALIKAILIQILVIVSTTLILFME